MKKVSIIVLVVFSLAFAGLAEAAKTKKRTRNANRVGAYGGLLVTQADYSSDQSANEQDLIDTFNTQGVPSQNVTASTKSDPVGYQAAFGYRFTRYFAAELGLAQYGKLKSTAKGQLDFGDGFLPASLSLSFKTGGPLFSAIGMLPVGEKFELFGRVGYLFASSDRTLSSEVDGQTGGGGTAKGDSQNLVIGVGVTYNINTVYSIRAEYQKLNDVGESSRTGTEDLSLIGIGFIVRF
jgi:opacity protein-like surface antigen